MGARGTDTSGPPDDADSQPERVGRDTDVEAGSPTRAELPPEPAELLLAGVRRLTLLADSAADSEAIFRGLARELLLAPGADEVHIHELAEASGGDDLVAVYLFGGDGRLSYRVPHATRMPGIERVASSAQNVVAADSSELAGVLPRLAQTGEASRGLLLPLVVHGDTEAVIVLVRRSAESFRSASIELATTLVDQAATVLALVRARAEAGTDPVTGCMNQRAMRRCLQEEIGRATRTGNPLSCLLIDLDDFKLVNDRLGHHAGDQVLREVCQSLVGEFRAIDRVARYGGDEFVVILPNADLESAGTAASRALRRLSTLSAGEVTPGVAASIGVGQWHSPMSATGLLQACDAALLRSKRQGKGRVTPAAERGR